MSHSCSDECLNTFIPTFKIVLLDNFYEYFDILYQIPLFLYYIIEEGRRKHLISGFHPRSPKWEKWIKWIDWILVWINKDNSW